MGVSCLTGELKQALLKGLQDGIMSFGDIYERATQQRLTCLLVCTKPLMNANKRNKCKCKYFC